MKQFTTIVVWVLAAVVFCAPALIAQTNTWQGGHGGDPTVWGTKQNWSLNLTPTTAHTVVIPTGRTYYPTLTANGVCGSLQVAAGASITTGTYKLTVSSTAAGAVTMNGTVNGELERTIASGSTATYVFTDPNTSIDPDGLQGNVVVSVRSYPGTTPPNLTQGAAVNRYYTVAVSGALTATYLRLAYLSSELNGITESNLTAYRQETPSLIWVDQSGSWQSGWSYVEVAGVSTWSNWTLGDATNPLPIQLASFSASVVNANSVQLDWTTITEVNNFGFYVQRRVQGETNFSELPNNFIPGHATTTEPQSYSWTHQNVEPGRYEYRLRQVDLDASETFTEPILVVVDGPMGVGSGSQVPAAFKLDQNYPNPFNPSTKITFSLAEPNFTTLKLFNVLGQEIATLFSGTAEAGRAYVINFDASNLGNGVYFYRLESGSQTDLKKMTLLK